MESKVGFNAYAQLRYNNFHSVLQCDRLFLGQALTFQSVCGCRTLLTKIRFTPLSVTFAELFLHLSEANDRVGERAVCI